MHKQTFGPRGVRPPAAILALVLILLALVVREARAPAPRPPFGHPPPAPPVPKPIGAELPPLDRLSRRYTGRALTLEVIYATPLLPSDEASGPVFRVVATYRASRSQPSFPSDLGSRAQLRTSDGRVRENLLWQEEVRHPDRVLGYLYCPPDERPLITRRTRWVELSLIGVTPQPLRFRWPVGGEPANGWRKQIPSDRIGP